MRLSLVLCLLLLGLSLVLADHGGRQQGRRRGRRFRNRGQKTLIRAKPRPQSNRFANFPAQQQLQQEQPAAPDFSNLGPPPQPAGFTPPRGVPAVRAQAVPARAARPQPVPVRAAPPPPPAPISRRRPQVQAQAPRGGRQLSASDPDVRGQLPDENGNYDFQFATDDGIFRQESGTVKNLGNEDANEIRGQYSFTSPEGEVITVNYVADETGFHATGSHIPQGPAIHPAIQRGLDLIARVNARKQQQG